MLVPGHAPTRRPIPAEVLALLAIAALVVAAFVATLASPATLAASIGLAAPSVLP